jgi:hypothetical protein
MASTSRAPAARPASPACWSKTPHAARPSGELPRPLLPALAARQPSPNASAPARSPSTRGSARRLRAGTVLTVTLTRPGPIGRVKTLTVPPTAGP